MNTLVTDHAAHAPAPATRPSPTDHHGVLAALMHSAMQSTPARGSPPTMPPLATLRDLAACTEPAYRRLRIDIAGSHIASQLCPFEDAQGHLHIFCVPDRLQSDAHRALQALLLERYGTQAAHLRSLPIEPILLLALVRERLDGSQLARPAWQGTGELSAVSTAFRDIVTWAVRQGASDVHFNIAEDQPDSQVHVHIDGHYTAPPHLLMPTARLREIVSVAWLDVVGGAQAIFDPRMEQQGRLYEIVDGAPYLLRWGAFATDRGPSVTLRLLPLSAPVSTADLADLGYLPSQAAQLERAMRSEGGAIVLGGVVGSGKSTTIAHLLGRLPRHRKIMTVEDPVERTIPGALQASIARSHGDGDGVAFATKLLALKRSAASDVLLGEVRDRETGRAFQDIVESGTNLYTTVHAGSAAAIAGRLASAQIGVSPVVLGAPGTLKLMVCQVLLPRLCADCAMPARALLDGARDAMDVARPRAYWQAYLDRLLRLYGVSADQLKIRNAAGCVRCRERGLTELFGYRGRTIAAELLELAHDPPALAAMARGDALALAARHQAASDGRIDSDCMDGKTAMECALYKMQLGMLDPRDIEPRFRSFESVERQRHPLPGTT